MMHLSRVESVVLQRQNAPLRYSDERVGVIVVDNFPELGRLTALRFLEWVQQNPEGVVSLPTGRTPEYFIKEVQRLLGEWNRKEVQKELADAGLEPAKKPTLRGLRFVQIDEFYPIEPTQENSFYHYVQKYYLQGFGIDPQRALLINCADIGLKEGQSLADIWPDGRVDLSLRYRQPANRQEELQRSVLEKIDQWCVERESRIRELGGIGFFLGGIGPDGHIGFNIRGSDFHSTTRLTPTNYETQAAAAGDLGGIEVARNRLVITIGLATIGYNPDCVALIIAAGEAKAEVVADAVLREQHIRYPATVLHNLPNARFYLTRGAAKLLRERRHAILNPSERLSQFEVERIVIDRALQCKTCIRNLTEADFREDLFGRLLLQKADRPLETILNEVAAELESRIEKGKETKSGTTFLHTEPHHDDIMLGYLPQVVRNIRVPNNHHYFATLTSGFTAVTNRFMIDQLQKLQRFIANGTIRKLYEEDYFHPQHRNRDVWQYLDGVAADSEEMKDEGQARRLFRNLVELYDLKSIGAVENKIDELEAYFERQYPGTKDEPRVQQLKGMCREWEADCLWGYFGWHSDSIRHLRLGFYQGEIFNEEPTVERDVMPVLELLEEVKPQVLTVALDPEASGPDTHYKVLQAINEALRRYLAAHPEREVEIWGYRNVWYRYHPAEANLFVPVSLNMFALQDNAFKNSFVTQKDASFPSYLHDGPFSELAQRIQVEQYQMMKTCLGRKFFYESKNALIRATRGLVFLKVLSPEEFHQFSRDLRRSTENA